MKYHVDSYDRYQFLHYCTDEAGETFRIDIQVNGDLDKKLTPESLVGKTVSIHHLIPAQHIGIHVMVL